LSCGWRKKVWLSEQSQLHVSMGVPGLAFWLLTSTQPVFVDGEM